jgi:crossover junction endodeoxyribonuclease RuvC
MAGMTIILGIDPGSRVTGYGVVSMERNKVVHLASGCIEVADLAFANRLCVIYDALSEVARTYQPMEAAIEKVFMSRNVDSALKLGQARGVAIVAMAKLEIPVHEYSPNEIKQAIVGRGHADKTQVQQMVKTLLSLAEVPRADAADALAIAMCHGHTRQGLLAVRSARGTRAGRYL